MRARKGHALKASGALESSVCINCGAESGEHYCPRCGEMRPDRRRYSLGDFLAHALESVTHVDNRIFRTLKALVLKPGLLTVEFMRGRRKAYMKPFQLFLVINVAFFLLFYGNALTTPLWIHMNGLPYSGLATKLVAKYTVQHGLTLPVVRQRFDRAVPVIAKSMVVLMVPLFALVMAFVGPWRRWFVERLVFALHFYGFFLLSMLVMTRLPFLLLRHWAVHFNEARADHIWSFFFSLLLMGYLHLALRTVYSLSHAVAFLRAFLLTIGAVAVLYVYRFLLFLIILYTLNPRG